MLGYYNNPEATARRDRRRRLAAHRRPGLRLPNGYYRITGRIKDMVIRGGENIYPREIEEFLFTHPAIEQAAVVGVPDPKYGEELCAWIKLKTGCDGDRGRNPRLLPRQAGPLQGAALRPVRRELSANRDRQDPEVQNPRNDARRVGPQRTSDGVVIEDCGSPASYEDSVSLASYPDRGSVS